MTAKEILITIILSLFSIVITIIITRHYSYRSCIAIIIASVFDIIDLSKVAKDKIEIFYNKIPIEQLWIIRAILNNQGNIDINSDMVHNPPSLRLIEDARIIDAENISNDNINKVDSFIMNEKSVVFNINYFQRRNLLAFQILVHTNKGISLKPDDIILSKGIIENTKRLLPLL
jgi:hypothetical protein